MHILSDDVDKRYLLDMIAYLLWHEETEYELSSSHIKFGKKLYREVLDTLKNDSQQWKASKNRNEFGNINLECQEMGNLFFLEKRLEKLEHMLVEKNNI